MEHAESYIDNTIQTPQNLPSNIMVLLDMLSVYDKERNSICYFDRLDDLWINAKNAIAAGVMSKKDWNILEQKYWIHAEQTDNPENTQ